MVLLINGDFGDKGRFVGVLALLPHNKCRLSTLASIWASETRPAEYNIPKVSSIDQTAICSCRHNTCYPRDMCYEHLYSSLLGLCLT